jgi:hypothetical protein
MAANHRFETIGDAARKGANFAVACSGCDRRAVIDGRWLERMFFVRRWDGRMSMLALRLRCGRCGARPDLVRVTHQRPTLDLPPRTDAEWRRLAARLRG